MSRSERNDQMPLTSPTVRPKSFTVYPRSQEDLTQLSRPPPRPTRPMPPLPRPTRVPIPMQSLMRPTLSRSRTPLIRRQLQHMNRRRGLLIPSRTRSRACCPDMTDATSTMTTRPSRPLRPARALSPTQVAVTLKLDRLEFFTRAY